MGDILLQRLLYTLVMMLSVALAYWVVRRRQSKLPLTESQRAGLAFTAFVGTMLGAKVPFLLELGWMGLLDGRVWFADGKTILGGIFGGYLAIELVKPWLGIRVSTGDSFALPVAVAVLFGRIGCFIAGCCFGTVTTLPWGVAFPLAGDEAGVYRHPTQIYESIFHGLAILVLIVAHRRNWIPGHQLKAYLLVYLLYRFLTEWIRPETRLGFGLTLYQLACVLIAIVLIALWVRDERRFRQTRLEEA